MHYSSNAVNNDIVTKIVTKISKEKNNSLKKLIILFFNLGVLISYASVAQFILLKEPKWLI